MATSHKLGPVEVPIRKQRVRLLGPEIGVTGLNRWGGQINEEFLRDLQGIRGIRAFREMRDNDATVGMMLNTIDLLARQADWRAEPADDSSEAKEAAEMVEKSIHEMSFSWEETISEILSFLPFGWAWFEVVYKKRDDGLIGWKKWAIRAQETLLEWRFDDEGGVKAMVQQALPDFRIIEIPIEKSLLFRTRIEKNNPQGKSILRSSYRSWYFKRRIEELEGIGIERDLAGIPVIQLKEGSVDLWNANDPTAVAMKTEFEKVLRNIRRDQHEGALLPYWMELKLLNTGGARQIDISKTLDRLDQYIARTAMMDFMLLGGQSVGSWALASSKTKTAAMAIGTYLDMIAAVVNRHAIPKLIEVNGLDKRIAPKLVHGDIESQNLSELGEYVSKLFAAGALTPDDELENFLRIQGNLPIMSEIGSTRTLPARVQNQPNGNSAEGETELDTEPEIETE